MNCSCRSTHKSIHSPDVNFTGAGDNENRYVLFKALRSIKIPPKAVQVVEVVSKYRRIRVGPSNTEEFEVVIGFKQQNVLSPMLKVVQVVEVTTK